MGHASPRHPVRVHSIILGILHLFRLGTINQMVVLTRVARHNFQYRRARQPSGSPLQESLETRATPIHLDVSQFFSSKGSKQEIHTHKT